MSERCRLVYDGRKRSFTSLNEQMEFLKCPHCKKQLVFFNEYEIKEGKKWVAKQI